MYGSRAGTAMVAGIEGTTMCKGRTGTAIATGRATSDESVETVSGFYSEYPLDSD